MAQFNNKINLTDVFYICIILFFFYLIVTSCGGPTKEKVDNTSNVPIVNTDRNAYTGLMCANESDPVHSIVNNSFACLVNPATQQCYSKSQLVDPSIPCDPVKFSAQLVKDLRNESTNSRKEFKKNNTYSLQQCTSTGLNNEGHWCKKTYDYYNTLCNDPKIPIKPNYCNDFKTVVGTKKQAPTGANDTILNTYSLTGASCNTKCLRSMDKNPDTGKRFTAAECRMVCNM